MADSADWSAVHLDEVEEIRWQGFLNWRPLRHALGTRIVGMSAYSASGAGEEVIEDHVEATDGRGHEEVYVVLAGSARFTLGDDQLDASAGTFVRVGPAARRHAVATAPDTIVLALGGDPTFEPSDSEWIERARPLAHENPEAAERIIAELRELKPESPALVIGDALLRLGRGEEDESRLLIAELLAERPHLREALGSDPDLGRLIS